MAEESPLKDKFLIKPRGLWLIGGITAASIIAAVVGFSQLSSTKASRTEQAPATTAPTPLAVTALGRLEPLGEVIKLSAPSSIEGTRVKELLVQQGATVKVGDVIAILDSRTQRAASVEQSERQVKVAEAKLSQVQAGAKLGEIDAQKATIARLEAQLIGERESQNATIARLKAQLQGEKDTLAATISRLEAQLKGDTVSQTARISRLEAQLKGEIAEQEATINRVQSQVNNAESEYNRNLQLYRDGVISISLLDSKRLTLETTQQQLKEEQANLNKIINTSQEQLIEEKATLQKLESIGTEQINEITATRRQTVETLEQQIKEAEANLSKTESTLLRQIDEAEANLARIAEVRPVDIESAQAEVNSALASVEKAKADLDQSYIKSPINGQVLKIHSRPGEVIGNDGIAEIGNTNQMFVVAEVYESDINKVKLGQSATITSGAINQQLQGTVAEVGLQIGKKDVLDTDPAADVDARVVEVKIRLDPESSQKVAGLTNMQVEVKIAI